MPQEEAAHSSNEEAVSQGLDAFFGGLDGFRDVFGFIFAKLRELDDRIESVSIAAALGGASVQVPVDSGEPQTQTQTEALSKHLRGIFDRIRGLENWQGATQNDLGKLATAINSLSTTVSQSLGGGGGGGGGGGDGSRPPTAPGTGTSSPAHGPAVTLSSSGPPRLSPRRPSGAGLSPPSPAFAVEPPAPEEAPALEAEAGRGGAGVAERVAALEGQLAALNAQLAQDVAALWDRKADAVELKEINSRIATQQGEIRSRVAAAESGLRRAIDEAVAQSARSLEATVTRACDARFAEKAEVGRMFADISELKADKTDFTTMEVRLESQTTFLGEQVEKLASRAAMADEVVKFVRREIDASAEAARQAREMAARVPRLEEELRAQLKATWQRLAAVAGDGGDPEDAGGTPQKREAERSVKGSEVLEMVQGAAHNVKLLRASHLELGERADKLAEDLARASERLAALEQAPARAAATAAAAGTSGRPARPRESFGGQLNEARRELENRIDQLQIAMQEMEGRHAGEAQSAARAMAEVQKQLRASGVAFGDLARQKASLHDLELHYALKVEVEVALGRAALRLKCLTCNSTVAPSSPAAARGDLVRTKQARLEVAQAQAHAHGSPQRASPPPSQPAHAPPAPFQTPPRTAPSAPAGPSWGRPSPGPAPGTAPAPQLAPLSAAPAAPLPGSTFFNNQGSIPTYTAIREPQLLRASASAPSLPPVGDKYVVKVAGYRWSREKNVAPVPLMPPPLVSPPSGGSRSKRVGSEDLIRTYFPREAEALLGRPSGARRPPRARSPPSGRPSSASRCAAALPPPPAACRPAEARAPRQAAYAQQLQSAAAQRALSSAAAAAAAAAAAVPAAVATVPRTGPLALAASAEPAWPAATRQRAPAGEPKPRPAAYEPPATAGPRGRPRRPRSRSRPPEPHRPPRLLPAPPCFPPGSRTQGMGIRRKI
eukprot:tig00001373_g8453.t1